MLQEAIDAKLFDEVRPISGAEGTKWARNSPKKDIFTGVSGGSTFGVARQVAKSAARRLGYSMYAARHRQHYIQAPLFEGIDAEMSEEELALSRSTPSAQSAGMTVCDRPGAEAQARPETLDPEDWDEALAVARQIIDNSVAYLRDVRERPVWRQTPGEVLAAFEAPLPRHAEPLSDVWREVAANVMSYPDGQRPSALLVLVYRREQLHRCSRGFRRGNSGIQPRRGLPCRGAPRPTGRGLAEVDGRLPQSASGTLVSGGSMGNIIALAVARNVKAGVDVRELGVAAIPKPLAFYGSDQIHSCHRKAMEALGLGNRALRRIATDRSLQIDLAALEAAIAADRRRAFSRPA